MLKKIVIYVQVGIAGQIDRPFLALIPSFVNKAYTPVSQLSVQITTPHEDAVNSYRLWQG
jgi:hypothetical protein